MTGRFKDDKTLPTLKEVRAELIEEYVRRCDGNLTEAARMIGLSYRTLHREMIKLGEANQHTKARAAAQKALDETKGNASAASRLLGRDPSYISKLISRGRVSRSAKPSR